MNRLGIIVLSMLFALLVVFNFYTTETFTTDISLPQITSVDVYEKNPSIQCDTLYYGSPFLTDSNDLFQARYCLQYKDSQALNPNYSYMDRFHRYLTQKMGVYIQSAPLETFDTDALRRLIRDKLFYFKLSNTADENPIQGPVFAVITQAPYYIDDQGGVIYHQPFNKDDYSYAPTLTVQQPDLTPPRDGLRIYAHLIYLMYKPDRSVVNISANDFDFKTYFKNKTSPLKALQTNNNMCRIRCVGDGIRGLLCGCVNQSQPYLSRCLGTTDDTPAGLQNTNQLTDYMMLYRINESASQVSGLFSETYFEDVKI
jgi:hypothetical protein